MIKTEVSHDELQTALDAHHEWILIDASGRSFAFSRNEIELDGSKTDKPLLGFLDERGFQTWRINDFQIKMGEIRLDLSRNFARERTKIRFIPRVSAKHLADAVELARIEKAHEIAALLTESSPKMKIVRIQLNKENGRFAQIILENLFGKQTAVLADVTDTLTPELTLSSAILWLTKLEKRRKNKVENVWIAARRRSAKNLQKLHALLVNRWKSKIFIKEIRVSDAQVKTVKDASEKSPINDLPPLEIVNLWRGKLKEAKPAANFDISDAARAILECAPAEIDVVFSAHGETLRFYGLPFARVRKIAGRAQIWFGIEQKRRLLTDENADELGALIEDLREFRRFDSLNKRHEFYRLAPEAWLEAILRKNIALLDANLILSPVYHQFRADRDKIDLLALRKDGRLVIIELKTAPDREMVFQAADYWRKIERLRRLGNLQKANLFGRLEVADRPAVCYLAAPTLSFHMEFDFLKSTLSEEIEFHRFNLTENWRKNVKILERRT